MGNSKNILPYAELVHNAKLVGGAEKYGQHHFDNGFNACKIIYQKKTSSKFNIAIALGAAFGIGAWELGKFGWRKFSEVLDKPVELKVHRILTQHETSTQTAAPEPTAVSEPIEATKPATNNAVENTEASVETSVATKDAADDDKQPLVVCEDDLDANPPEWFEKMYAAMCLLREGCP